MAISPSASLDTEASTSRSSLTLSESERLDALDPLRHLLQSEIEPEDSESNQLLPSQRHTIKDETYVVRYFRDSKLKPETVGMHKGKAKEMEPIDCSLSPTQEDSNQYDIILNCDQGKGCGGIIWPAAEVLGQYIASNQQLQDRWRTKNGGNLEIVELGSGTGLVGLLVRKIGFGKGARGWITDQSQMLEVMQTNLDLNQGIDECKVAELNWGEPLPENVPHKPDVLLLADCVYLEVAFQPLVDTMIEMSTKDTEILFCYQKRRKADKRFFSLLKKHFTFTDIQDDDPERSKIYRREGTQLLWVVKK